MGFYVPYVVNGAKHSARLFRRAYQQQSGEGSGVSRPGDLKVSALAVPGTGFRVAAGGGIAQSRDTSASSRESYGPINDAQITITDVPGTGSSGGRRDLVILEITDPEMESVTYPAPTTDEGWQDGNNFCRVTIIPGVAASVTSLDQITTGPYANVTGITLAAINWPSSTGTITNAMITDLRAVHRPREQSRVIYYSLSGSEVDPITATSAYPGGETWPIQAENAGELELNIPIWATHAEIEATFYGVKYPGGDAWGSVWVQIGPTVNPSNVKTQDSRWDTTGVPNGSRSTIGLADTRSIPAALRGTRQKFYPRATRVSGSNAATARLDAVSSIAIKVTFQERAV